MGKSMILTYVLWLVGGIFGLHHFYLGRDLQGFLWWCTLGGYMGFGWLRDVFLIPNYVADANEEPKYVKKLVENVRAHEKPPFSTTRFVGMTIIGYVWSAIMSMAIPNDHVWGYSWHWLQILIPLACALGVWSVGNIGHEEGSIWWPLAAAYLTFPLYLYESTDTMFTIMVVASAFAFDIKAKKWRKKAKKKKSLKMRVLIISACALLYISLWCSYLYFNANLIDEDGEEIPLHEAIHHFIRSPWWTDLKQSLYDTWVFAQRNGWIETWRQVLEMSDLNGEQNAYKVLDLSTRANQTEINSRCRMLAVKWHPDRVKDPKEKEHAQEQFYEVQRACEILSTSKVKRRRKNKKYTDEL